LPGGFACLDPTEKGKLIEFRYFSKREVMMFVHAVYFWLKATLSRQEQAEFLHELRNLATIESIQKCYIGEPAGTDREVIDRSYSYALVVIFADQGAHDAYQEHPTHDRFRERCSSFWEKVQIYDSVESK
jgi:hypothetical protein